MSVLFSREFAMPNASTFSIGVIDSFVRRWFDKAFDVGISVDPFCGDSRLCTIRNDVNPAARFAHANLDALVFLSELGGNIADLVILDPPYSPRQIAESYKSFGGSWDGRHPSFMATIRDHTARITRRGGIVLSFGWNSTGLGKGRGFKLQEVLLVNHGGSHNDTICIAERKIREIDGEDE